MAKKTEKWDNIVWGIIGLILFISWVYYFETGETPSLRCFLDWLLFWGQDKSCSYKSDSADYMRLILAYLVIISSFICFCVATKSYAEKFRLCVVKHIGYFLFGGAMIFLLIIIQQDIKDAEWTRNLIFGLGGFGALYGLVHSARRTDNDQKQLANDRDQLFNEKLGRGIELLGKDKQLTMRVAGMRLLDNLAESSDNNKNIELIIDILRGYLSTETKANKGEKDNIDPKKPMPRDERVDIELCVEVILKYPDKKKGKYLENVDLRKLNFNNKNLSKTILRKINFSGAKLMNTNLTAAKLIKADLTKANLSEANLKEAKLLRVILRGTRLIKADLTKARLRKVNLTEADLSGAVLVGAELRYTDMTKAVLQRANLTEADLSEADLTEARLQNVGLTGAGLTGADLTGADLTGADLTGADLTGADLTGADLTGADLTGADLTEADLMIANLTGAKLRGVRNLIQEQMDLIIYEKGKPPQDIPEGLILPEATAYIVTDGNRKVFVPSDEEWSEQDVDEFFDPIPDED